MDLKKLKLNPQQEEAVVTTEGPVLVVAGAGSGKTKVLTTRIAHLIDNLGITDKRILAITFTNIAAREMRERVDQLVGHHINSMICTYHSLCLNILKHDAGALKDGDNNFRVIDEEDKMSVVKQIYHDWNLYGNFNKIVSPKLMYNLINDIQFAVAKEDYLLWSPAYTSTSQIDMYYKQRYELKHEFKDTIPSIYREYQKRKKENRWLDFNDLLIGCDKLLNARKDVAHQWANSFDYILVDEFQDTDILQFEILSLLTNKNQNVFAVGDPDQTIYEWRGAYSGVFKDFENTFDHTQIIFLNKNYRSTPQILNAANSLIANNVSRYEKNLETDNQDGDLPIYYLGDTQHEEGRFIANKIKELVNSKKYEYRNITVLYRANHLSRFVEEALMNEQIPYVILGGVKFYQRKEIKDILAYLQLINNSDDELAIRRIINVPGRKIGETTLDKITEYAKAHKISFTKALRYTKQEHHDITWDDIKIGSFLALIHRLKEKAIDKKPSVITEMVIKDIKYQEYLSSFELPEDWMPRMENLEELIRAMKEYEEANPDGNLDGFLQSIALLVDTTSNDTRTKDRNNVVLMTVHTAKGTEWPIVFMIGLYEGVFPHTDYRGYSNIEEERRIAFVGITRAKHKLFLTSSNTSGIANVRYYPSSFFDEIGSKNYQKLESTWATVSNADLSWYDSKKQVDYKSMYEKKNDDIHLHDTIVHTTFGIGVVIEEDGEFITVAFKAPYGQKTLMKNHKFIKRVKN